MRDAVPGCHVLGIGELLWDLLPSGLRLGGAPFNVVAHLRRLGHDTSYVTTVGNDELGRRAISEVHELEVDGSLIRVVSSVPTGTASVELDTDGRPTWQINSPAAYELTEISSYGLTHIARAAPCAIVFGTGTQRFPSVRHATVTVLNANPTALRVYDVNLRGGGWTTPLVEELTASANVLKMNEEELQVLGRVLGLPIATPEAFARAAAERFDLTTVCVTRGSRGAVMWTPHAYMIDEGFKVTVSDTIGAGDAVTAGLIHGLLTGSPGGETLELANALGALVSSRPGAIPAWTPRELTGLIRRRRRLRMCTAGSLASAEIRP